MSRRKGRWRRTRALLRGRPGPDLLDSGGKTAAGHGGTAAAIQGRIDPMSLRDVTT